MIDAPNYYKATNAAYDLLTDQDLLEIPVNLNNIILLYNKHTRLMTYAQMAARFNMTLSQYKSIALNITNLSDYVGWFHISDLMAENCIKNITSDRYYIEDKLYRIVDSLIYTFMTGESLASAYGYGYYN